MTQLRDLMMHGLICNIHSTPTENTHLGKLLAIRSPGISITSTDVMPFSIFHQPHSEEKSKTTTSLLLRLFGIGTHKTERSVGTPAALPLSMPTILSVSISQKPTASSEVNAKEETFQLKKDKLWSMFKR